ncbi:hypothetical protein V2S66_29995 [Streptomyces sp. V4-01]|uniref:Uncharacterized protein n=1 Tax=Actinacidiphila polyblastidii TaxID=3110430 RepID=A0ABU7PMB0_9ACTN|nr:hypothetical protein [Streptomyces sp. V4-01]
MNPYTPAGVNEPIVHRHWLADAAPKAAPAVATSTVLILARIWNAHGAQHSIGDATVMSVLAVGAAFAGRALATGENGDSTAASIGFTAAGTLATAGVAAYSDGLPLPLLLWSVATVLSYVLVFRQARAERRERIAYERATQARRETQHHVETVEVIRARAQVETAREGAAYANALTAAMTARAALPGYDPAVVTAAGRPEIASGSPTGL